MVILDILIMCKFCRFCKHSSLSMKIELCFISESFSRADFMLSSFWWDFSAILNWKKNNSITRWLHHLMRVGTYNYVRMLYLVIYKQNFMKSYRSLNALSCFILLMTLSLSITWFFIYYTRSILASKRTRFRLFLLRKHSSLSMKVEWDLVSISVSRFALLLSRSWWNFSASLS